MADSFMIKFPFNGKSCYANVYAPGSDSRKFYVHLINPQICPALPHEMTFTENGGKLHYTGTQHVPGETLRGIEQAVERMASG